MDTNQNSIELKILFLEDEKDDVSLMRRELKRAGLIFSYKQVVARKEFLESLYSFKPDIIIADYTLPSFNGMHAFRIFKDQKIDIPFILVTGSLDEDLAAECLNDGVDDILIKGSYQRLPSKILRCVNQKRVEIEREKLQNELESNKKALTDLLEHSKKQALHEQLSSREYEIFCLIGSGYSIKDIADQLSISPSTVATYRSRIMEKTNLKSNVEITRYAILNKLVE